MFTPLAMCCQKNDALYSTGKCSNKIMLIEEGTVTIRVPASMQHLTQPEIEAAIGDTRHCNAPAYSLFTDPLSYKTLSLPATLDTARD